MDRSAVATEPTRAWRVLLILATLGVAAGWFGPIQILLPSQALAIAGDGGKEKLLALVTGIGAAVSMVANPAWGMLSDRLYVKRGSRMPVLLAGLVTGLVGLVVLFVAAASAPMIAGWILVQIGLNGPFAVLLAMIADQVPERLRGSVGSWFGIAQMLGTVLGTIIAVVAGEGRWGYIALIVAVPCLVVPIVAVNRRASSAERTIEREPFRWRDVRVDSQFAAAFAIRFLMNLVSALSLLYLLYFLRDRIGVDEPGTWVLVCTLVYVTIAGVCAGVAGSLSDKRGKRKMWILIAAVCTVIGGVLFGLATSVALLFPGIVFVAAGNGFFLAVDVSIITSVLPDEKTRATMLGVANIASASPQVLAPVIAAPIVLGPGYFALYLVTGLIGLASAAFLPAIKRVS